MTGFIKILSISSKVYVIDTTGTINKISNINLINDDFSTFVKDMNFYFNTNDIDPNETYYIFCGFGELKNILSMSDYDSLVNILKQSKDNIHYIIFDSKDNLNNIKLEPWFKTNVSLNNYLWLGEGITMQSFTSDPNLSFEDKKLMFKNIGYIVKDGYCNIIKFAVDTEAKNEK